MKEKLDKENKKKEEMNEPNLDDWLEKRNKKRLKLEPEGDVVNVTHELPPFLMNIPNLPPSLLPPTTEELQNKPVCEWG